MASPLTEPGKLGKRLSPQHKQALLAGIAAGRSQKDVAHELGVNPDTVSKLAHTTFGEDWQTTFKDARDPIASTIVKAATDQEDVHKAAITGLKLFQGMGLLNGDTPTTVVNILNIVNASLPGDLQFDIVSTDEVLDAQAVDPTDFK